MYQNGKIYFLGDYGNDPTQQSQTEVSGVAGQAELDTFAAYLDATISDCNLFGSTLVSTTPGTAGAPGVAANVDRKAVFVCRDDSNGKTIRMEIPAPKDLIVETTPSGERILQATVDEFALALGGATGKAITGRYGYVKQKK